MANLAIRSDPWNPLGVVGCATATIGWVVAAVWYSDRNWGTFWTALALFMVSTAFSYLGWQTSYGVVGRAVPALGLVLSAVGILVLLVLAMTDDGDTDTDVFRVRRRRYRRRRGYRRRRRRRR